MEAKQLRARGVRSDADAAAGRWLDASAPEARPLVECTLRDGRRGPLRLVLFSAARPSSADRYATRDAELERLAALPMPPALPRAWLGDFNAPPWSPALRGAAAAAGMRLASTGRFRAWPPRTWPDGPLLGLGVPIDVCLVSEGVAATAATGPSIGSDHRPLLATVLPPPATRPDEDPAPMNDTAQRLRAHVEALAGGIGPRHQGDPGSILRTRAYLRAQWEAMGLEVRVQAYDCEGFEAQNLFVELPGENPEAPGLVIGAHHDTIPTTPGADDNASAVAVLLEISRALAGTTTRVPVTLVSFANEEPPFFHTPLMGSAVFAEDLKRRGVKLQLMICLEMVGFFDDTPGSQRYPEEVPADLRTLLPDRGDFLAAVPDPGAEAAIAGLVRLFAERSDLPLLNPPLPDGLHGLFWLSDHGPFWDRGFPAVMLTDTSFLRNPHYHRASDTADTLDFARMRSLTDGLAHALRAMAGVAPAEG